MSNHNNTPQDAQTADEASLEFRHADIEALAYKLWVVRGCPGDSADEDWFLAAKRLREAQQ